MSCAAQKEIINAAGAPKAIGPYSHAVKACQFLFSSGQLGLDPATGVMIEGGVEAETRQALLNLKAVLEAGGSSLAQVLKTTVYLRDMADFTRVNTVYAEFFKENPPARSAVQVAALPRNGAVEIEAVALVPAES